MIDVTDDDWGGRDKRGENGEANYWRTYMKILGVKVEVSKVILSSGRKCFHLSVMKDL